MTFIFVHAKFRRNTPQSRADRWSAIIRSYDELRVDEYLIYRIFL